MTGTRNFFFSWHSLSIQTIDEFSKWNRLLGIILANTADPELTSDWDKQQNSPLTSSWRIGFKKWTLWVIANHPAAIIYKRETGDEDAALRLELFLSSPSNFIQDCWSLCSDPLIGNRSSKGCAHVTWRTRVSRSEREKQAVRLKSCQIIFCIIRLPLKKSGKENCFDDVLKIVFEPWFEFQNA